MKNKMYKNSFHDEKWGNNANKKTIRKSRFVDTDEYDDWRIQDFRTKTQSFERSKNNSFTDQHN